MSTNITKKPMIGRVKNCKVYPEGRTSLLTLVNMFDGQRIVPRHVNLCIQTTDVEREGIKQYSVVLFEAAEFQKWRIGQDRFLGHRQTNDRDDNKYHLPMLSETGHKLGTLGSWADMDHILQQDIDPNLFLGEGVNPIWSLMGFDPESVALVENYKPDTPTMVERAASVATVLFMDNQEEISNPVLVQ